MKRILLVSLPMMALLGCGTHKKEKSVANAPTTTNTSETSTVNNGNSSTDTPSLPAAATSTSTSNSTSTSTSNGNGKGSDNGKGETPNQSTDNGKGETGQNGGKDTPATPSDCEVRVLDFDKKPNGSGFGEGEKVKEQYRSYGVRFEAYRRGSSTESFDALPKGEAIIFNSAGNPDAATRQKYLDISRKFGNDNGFDDDLLTSKLGNVLIIAEHTYDIDPKDAIDWVTYPDDNTNGGKIKLYFDKPTRVLDMDFVAVVGNQSKIELWSGPSSDKLVNVHSQTVPTSASNSVNRLTVGNSGFVNKLKIIMNGGGAVDNIRICVKK